MNCWIWIILLWCFCGKNCCGNNDMCDEDNKHDCGCNRESDSRRSIFSERSGCGCNDDNRQSRGFVGFGDNSTCGCEEKNN